MSKIGIVTVLYNSATVLEDFFMTLKKQIFKDFTLYIVDNNSPDDSWNIANELAKTVDFKCVLIQEKNNWGIAKGNNIGIRAALNDGCGYVLLANNDITINDDAIDILYRSLVDTDANLAVPKIYYYGTNLIWQAGGNFNKLKATTHHRGNLEEDNGQYDLIECVDYSSTCFMLIHRDVFNRVGLMDELYFVYYDDTDFVYRCTQENSEKLVYVPSSVVNHKVSTSTQKGSDFYNRMMFRNRVLFVRKNFASLRKIITIANLFIYHYSVHPFVMDKNEFIVTSKAMIEGINMEK